MNQSRYEAALSRRSMLARLAAAGASFAGLTAFSRFDAVVSKGGPKWDDAFELGLRFVRKQFGHELERLSAVPAAMSAESLQ